MAIGAIELQGAITRVQDYASIRQNEDGKIISDQAAVVSDVKKEAENKSNAVNRGDDVTNNQKKFDAREKGSNEYYGDGGRNRNQAKDQGKVMAKGQTESFDIRI